MQEGNADVNCTLWPIAASRDTLCQSVKWCH